MGEDVAVAYNKGPTNAGNFGATGTQKEKKYK